MTKNTKTILLIGALLVIGLLAYLSTTNKDLSVVSNGPLRDFAYEDTSAITRFTISDTQENLITITRENPEKVWMIEGTEFKAKPENADLVLDALKRIAVRQDLDEQAIENSISYLIVSHKKVDFFINNEKKPIKTWYIGHSTVDHQGTHMLLEEKGQKSSVPFIVYKPGMRGALDARFFINFDDWQFTGIFNYPIGSVRTIAFNNFDEPTESFSITVDKNSKVNLLDQQLNPVPVFDTLQVSHYVTHFKRLHFAHKATDITQAQADSVLAVPPNLTIEVTDDKGTKKKVNVWKIFDEEVSEEGVVTREQNTGYAFLSINGSSELVRVQFHQWDNVLKPKSYFTPKKA